MLYVEFLGRVRVTCGRERNRLNLSRQSVGLLAHFALSRSHREAREVLIERFWPDSDPPKGRSNLSSALSRLRRGLGPIHEQIISVDHSGEAGIAEGAPLWFDAEAFRASVRPACSGHGRLDENVLNELCRGLDLYCGELLDGFYDDWVLAEREQLRALYIRGRLRLLDHYIAGEELDAALECGREILRLDPLREAIHRRMMELYARNGEPAAVRRQYNKLVTLLSEELGVAPALESEALYRRL